ncbi:MAG TPA: hypothetical protein PKM30_11960 [Saprospiraceae bacterium]|jgi:hypothetical protein|nr:hypothetical protein [Saprospiraceae bacterium]HNK72792.1 hypothetical protein [Saprospiraceae bacterium]HPE08450.1 hypothetical protein [Saprospiraceae bacterium]
MEEAILSQEWMMIKGKGVILFVHMTPFSYKTKYVAEIVQSA